MPCQENSIGPRCGRASIICSMKKFPRPPRSEIREMSAARMRALVAQRKLKASPAGGEGRHLRPGQCAGHRSKPVDAGVPCCCGAVHQFDPNVACLRHSGHRKGMCDGPPNAFVAWMQPCRVGVRAGKKYHTGSQSSYRLRGVAA